MKLGDRRREGMSLRKLGLDFNEWKRDQVAVGN